jgi:ribosomal protein S18 acetylase RimI-like enzyme
VAEAPLKNTYDEFEITVIQQSMEQGFYPYEVSVTLREDCLLKAARVFMVFEAPSYTSEAVELLRADFAHKKTRPDIWITGGRLMFVALDCDTVVGMADARDNGHIQSFYVESAYHRRGIGTELMNHMVCELKLRGFDHITLDSSPYGLPFYLKFGFYPTGMEQKTDGFIGTPMAYEPSSRISAPAPSTDTRR